jgi:hypothetical protein
MIAYLFLPKRSEPPYQVVVFFPPGLPFIAETPSDTMATNFFDFVVKSGWSLRRSIKARSNGTMVPRVLSHPALKNSIASTVRG